MEWMKANDVAFSYDEEALLQHVSISIQAGEVIGIIGKNGAGKSTLLSLLTGALQPTAGQIQWFQKQAVTEVAQEVAHVETTVYTSMHRKWHVPDIAYSAMSGGQQLKYRLVNGFLTQASLLLLDEPTNHLDEASLKRLVKEIRLYNKGSVIIVSHDRYFLDEVATKIWALEDGTVYEQIGNYSHYEQVRRKRRETQQRAHHKQQQKKQRIEQEIAQLTGWSNSAHRDSTKQEGAKEYYRLSAKRMDAQIKSKRRRLEKELATSEVTAVVPEHRVHFELRHTEQGGKRLFTWQGVSKKYNDKTILTNITGHILHGQRIALTGMNGAGKSTFLRLLLQQEEPTSGEVWRSPSVTVGYLSQQVFDLDDTQTPAQLFQQQTFEARGMVQTFMHQLGFHAGQWQSPISKMSMGERVKLKLMHYIVAGTDCLVLDEPTNHLDLPSREQFEETLNQYRGTIIVVSHDRYFREKVTTEAWEIRQRTIHYPTAAPQETSQARQLALETELQYILGKLSVISRNDVQYDVLDQKFQEITQQLKQLRAK